MTEIAYSRCARPQLTAKRISTYTILGFTGFAVANLVGAILAVRWQLALSERLIAFFAPALAFVMVVTISSALAGHERIVFYQTTVAGVVSVIVLGVATRADVPRLLDLVILGIGIFLVFGRLGCHSVACCHGTLGRGVTYGPAHVAIGFFARWSGRSLWPVQLVEATASAVLVAASLAASSEPGRAALVYAVGYAGVRFALELVRGDSARFYAGGVSEAQWVAAATALAAFAWRPGVVTGAIAAALSAASAALMVRRKRRELVLPPHVVELDRVLAAASDGARHETSLGVAVSRHALPDGRIDWILSSEHTAWSEAMARRIAAQLWTSFEVVAGRTAGVIHILEQGGAT